MRMFMLVGVLLAAASSAFAQAVREKQKPGAVRVAVVNVAAVFSRIGMSTGRDWELEWDVNWELPPMLRRAEILRLQMKGWKEVIDLGNLEAKSVQRYEAAIRDNQIQVEKLDAKIKKIQEKDLVNKWHEMRAAIKTYAAAHDIVLVIAYGDPLDNEQVDQFPNIERKMQAMERGGVLPIFFARHVDISDAVIAAVQRSRSK